ncbi:MAG: hypothetical protein Pg6B_07730 [Candidatus Azobacteroides pseudotrichonymphae]|jgi:ribosome-associated protein|uniref:Ribosomal silencing factor RsfS n=1 Tax=Azobacteroides pseudotrichonymphae genomovar. CFP2 TaxID=511995 RepID=B6YRM7_AZOPC|nr:ribosome silencing factor [Candidatus Azobacteroides pseudotrichonymphae]BAG83849.1 conserved hypothetical protein [Candidatus Azobacteroides pseudotrichonymphae genomovar. CFP2]GMO11764.1 MAG: hypothetical protein Ta2D_13820 [Rickettsiales bacterium]GMO36488.1 MAG: hypothetical protein Pg6B_07730 [Candidatus Azobacteroides pseudotrichonymphae]
MDEKDNSLIKINIILKALKNKKGKKITVLDLTKLENSICEYLIIAQGNIPNQVLALCDSVWNLVYSCLQERPLGAVGMKEAKWIVTDYGTIMLHLFIPEFRVYYDLENLWANANIIEIPDML